MTLAALDVFIGGRGSYDCTSHPCSDPVTGFALVGHVSIDPSGKIVAMAARRHNELMNHCDTPRYRAISILMRMQRTRSLGTQVADRSKVSETRI